MASKRHRQNISTTWPRKTERLRQQRISYSFNFTVASSRAFTLYTPLARPPNTPANRPTMPARLDGNVRPARRNAFFRAKSAETIATSDATEAKGEGPTLAAGMMTSGAEGGCGETTAACGREVGVGVARGKRDRAQITQGGARLPDDATPCHTIPCGILRYDAIRTHTTPYIQHTIHRIKYYTLVIYLANHIAWYGTPYHNVSYHAISYQRILYHASYHIIPYHTMP